MADNEIPAPEEKGEDMGTVVLMLSLYLIILAFFILLNAISETSQQKVELAVESLAENFSFQTVGEGMLDDESEMQVLPAYDYVAKDIRGLIEAFLTMEGVQFRHEEKQVRVVMPADKLFQAGELRLQPQAIKFIENLATLLGKFRYGVEIHSKVTVQGNRDQVSAFSPAELAGRQSTLLVRALVDRKVRPETLTAAALLYDKVTAVEFIFDLDMVDEAAARSAARDFNRSLGEAL